MFNISANLNVMIAAARKASRRLVRDFGEIEELQSSRRGASNFARKAVQRAEDTLREELAPTRPAYGWFSPLAGNAPGADPTRRWVVNPLDGMFNYSRAAPHWAICIALEHKKDIVAGVIFDPVKDELFFAEKGAGAFVNDRRLRAAAQGDVAAGNFGLYALGENAAAILARDMATLGPHAGGLRLGGCAALDMGWVAAGRFDGAALRSAGYAALAPGMIIIREAGGLLRDIEGEALAPEADALICASNDMLAPFLRAMQRR